MTKYINAYNNYKIDRDLVWQLYLDLGINQLPININPICRMLNIQVKMCNMNGSGYTATLRKNEHVIFINKNESKGRQRFTCAHELGHILLKHTNAIGKLYRDPQKEDNLDERDANVFASRLLAPAIILRDINATNAPQIAKICKISIQAAEFRAERLKLLLEREQIFLKRYNKSCFGLSPLERRVESQFKEFIEAYKGKL